MTRAALDSNVLIAGHLRRDEDHDHGRALLEAIADGDLPRLSVPVSVLHETVNYVYVRSTDEAAWELFEVVLAESNLDVLRDDRETLETGRTVFGRYEEPSPTDSVIVASFGDGGYVYPFDDDFDAVDGLTRLDAPVNPFG